MYTALRHISDRGLTRDWEKIMQQLVIRGQERKRKCVQHIPHKFT
jgi:hypothetical protein